MAKDKGDESPRVLHGNETAPACYSGHDLEKNIAIKKDKVGEI